MTNEVDYMTKKDNYIASIREIKTRLEKGGNLISDLGNITAVLNKRMDYYWVGFYFVEKDRLVLGPFQGTPACVFLDLNEGVCSACLKEKKTIIVPDVDNFPSHIVCDPNSRSEIVTPCYDSQNTIRAILDIDSDKLDFFDETDKKYLEEIAELTGSLW